MEIEGQFRRTQHTIFDNGGSVIEQEIRIEVCQGAVRGLRVDLFHLQTRHGGIETFPSLTKHPFAIGRLSISIAEPQSSQLEAPQNPVLPYLSREISTTPSASFYNNRRHAMSAVNGVDKVVHGRPRLDQTGDLHFRNCLLIRCIKP